MVTHKPIIAAIISIIVLGTVGCASQREQTGQYASDSWISGKVNSALLADPQISGMDVEVETHQGTVQLSGFVDSSFQKRHAEEIAQSISGVKAVINDIRVKK